MTLWPQYVYLALSILGLGMSIASHGQPRQPQNAWTTVIASGLVLFLLAKGGFFDGLLK